MSVLPIVERELRVAARLPRFYRARLGLPLAACLMFCVFTVIGTVGVSQQVIGQQLFYLSFGMLFLAGLGGGCQLTADTISSEKREGTLGFLFLTDLKGYDIVLGKLVSSSMGAIYSALGLLPLVAIMFLFGGVTGGAMLRLTVSSLNVLFLSLAVGLVSSCLVKEANRARGIGLLCLVALIVAGPLVGLLWSLAMDFPASHKTINYWGPFLATSPVVAFPVSLDMLYQQGAYMFWVSNGVVHALGWFFLLLASWLVPRSWQDRAATKRQFRWQDWWRRMSYGTSETMAKYRRRLLDINAVHWLTSRERFKVHATWLYVCVLIGIWFWFWWLLGKDWLKFETAIAFCILTNSILKSWVALEAAKRFSTDRESGALELLLCTSLPVPEITHGQLLSVRRQFLKPFMVVFGLELILFVGLGLRQPWKVQWEIVALLLSGFIIYWADFYTLPWVGMWRALTAKKSKNAGAEATAMVLSHPYLLLWLWMGAVGLVVQYFSHTRLRSEVFMFGSWFAISLGVNVLWIWLAKKRLYSGFRAIAMSRYVETEEMTVWGWIGHAIGRLLRWSRRSKKG